MKKYILYAAVALLAMTGCSDSDYTLDKLVPGEYHKIMLIKDGGKHTKTLLDVEDDDVTSITIQKLGSDPTLTANVNIRTLTDEELDSEYSQADGINYKQLPADCYALDNTNIEFSSSDRYKKIQLAIHPQKVKEQIAANADVKWVIPLKMESQKDSVNANSDEYFVVINNVISPTIGFISATPDARVIEKAKAADYTEKLTVGIDTENKWEVECKLGIDGSYVNAYNKKNGTSYELLPADCYEMPASVKLNSGSNDVLASVKVKASSLPAGDYILPVAVTEVSEFKLSASNVMPLVVRVMGNKLDRTGWTATADTENRSDGCTVDKMLDGNVNSIWHSQWSGGTHALPDNIIIDMKAEYSIDHVSLRQRVAGEDYRDTKTVEIYTSKDGSNWTFVGTCNMAKVQEDQIFKVTTSKGRYMKLKVTESYRAPHVSIAEFYAYGE